MRISVLLILLLLLTGCRQQAPSSFVTEVLNGYTPVKNQGKSQTCWAYAMLAAIETEHIMRGDSVHLSPAYVEMRMTEDRRHAGPSLGVPLWGTVHARGVCA